MFFVYFFSRIIQHLKKVTKITAPAIIKTNTNQYTRCIHIHTYIRIQKITGFPPNNLICLHTKVTLKITLQTINGLWTNFNQMNLKINQKYEKTLNKL